MSASTSGMARDGGIQTQHLCAKLHGAGAGGAVHVRSSHVQLQGDMYQCYRQYSVSEPLLDGEMAAPRWVVWASRVLVLGVLLPVGGEGPRLTF